MMSIMMVIIDIKYIEDITWLHGDMKFVFDIFQYFSTQEDKFLISKQPYDVPFII